MPARRKIINSETLRETLKKTKWNLTETGRLLGCHRETIRRLIRELELEQAIEEIDITEIEFEGQAIDEKGMLKHLIAKGYNLAKHPEPTGGLHVLDAERFSGDSIRLGVVSDTHLCSKCQQLSHLHSAYAYFKEQGITDVLHAGDITAGNGKVYRGQEYELFLLGADAQAAYAIEHYPRIEGITTHVISGNHDLSFMKSDGLDIIRMIAREREDIDYLGPYNATLDMDSIRVMLHHGDGGGAYARSYKLQKLIEQLAPQNKPHIFITGHYHVNCWLPMYRNVSGFMVGCFESQTSYLLRKGLNPEIGFYVLDIIKDSTGIISVKPDWKSIFVPLEKDY